jgi:hypothetical protein
MIVAGRQAYFWCDEMFSGIAQACTYDLWFLEMDWAINSKVMAFGRAFFFCQSSAELSL